MTIEDPTEGEAITFLAICAAITLAAFIFVGWLCYQSGHQDGIEEAGEYWSQTMKDVMK